MSTTSVNLPAFFQVCVWWTVWVCAPLPSLAASSPTSAQVPKALQMDGMEIGVTSGFYIHRAEGAVALKRFSIRPAIGYFLSDRLELRVGYDYEEIKRNRDVARTHVMLIGPIWYVPVADRVTGYFQVDIGPSRSVIRLGGSETEDHGLTTDLGMGTQVFVNEMTALDLGARWVWNNEMSDRDRVDLYVGTSFFIK